MIARIYRQAYDDSDYGCVEVSAADEDYGFTSCICPDCNGTGLFEISNDDVVMCVPCKGTGRQWVTL